MSLRKKKMKTQFKVGQKVYEKINDNILVWTIISIETTTSITKEETITTENYYVERKEKV
jgi:hypothetical protein